MQEGSGKEKKRKHAPEQRSQAGLNQPSGQFKCTPSTYLTDRRPIKVYSSFLSHPLAKFWHDGSPKVIPFFPKSGERCIIAVRSVTQGRVHHRADSASGSSGAAPFKQIVLRMQPNNIYSSRGASDKAGSRSNGNKT